MIELDNQTIIMTGTVRQSLIVFLQVFFHFPEIAAALVTGW